jgi:hypothetical protein
MKGMVAKQRGRWLGREMGCKIVLPWEMFLSFAIITIVHELLVGSPGKITDFLLKNFTMDEWIGITQIRWIGT